MNPGNFVFPPPPPPPPVAGPQIASSYGTPHQYKGYGPNYSGNPYSSRGRGRGRGDGYRGSRGVGHANAVGYDGFPGGRSGVQVGASAGYNNQQSYGTSNLYPVPNYSQTHQAPYAGQAQPSYGYPLPQYPPAQPTQTHQCILDILRTLVPR